jgi:CRP-like cAMP-binding protein
MVNSHKELQWRRSQGVDESKLFDDLPKSVQQEIKNFLYLDLVKKVPLFQDTDSHFQNSVTLKIKPMHIIQGCYIFRKDDEGQEMFFIKSGQVDIVGDSGQVFVTLGTGSFFGEIALFKNCKRTASARAKGDVELCMLAKDDYNFILSQFPIISERIQKTIRDREENELKKKAEAEAAKKAEEEKKAEDERKAAEKLANEKLQKERGGILGSISSIRSKITGGNLSVASLFSNHSRAAAPDMLEPKRFFGASKPTSLSPSRIASHSSQAMHDPEIGPTNHEAVSLKVPFLTLLGRERSHSETKKPPISLPCKQPDTELKSVSIKK